MEIVHDTCSTVRWKSYCFVVTDRTTEIVTILYLLTLYRTMEIRTILYLYLQRLSMETDTMLYQPVALAIPHGGERHDTRHTALCRTMEIVHDTVLVALYCTMQIIRVSRYLLAQRIRFVDKQILVELRGNCER